MPVTIIENRINTGYQDGVDCGSAKVFMAMWGDPFTSLAKRLQDRFRIRKVKDLRRDAWIYAQMSAAEKSGYFQQFYSGISETLHLAVRIIEDEV